MENKAKDQIEIAKAVCYLNSATEGPYEPNLEGLTGFPLIDQDAGGQVIHYTLDAICDELNSVVHPMDSKLFPLIQKLSGNKIKSFRLSMFGNKVIIKLNRG